MRAALEVELEADKRTFWRVYESALAWEHLGTPQEELESVNEERDIWVPSWTCCYCDLTVNMNQKLNEWIQEDSSSDENT